MMSRRSAIQGTLGLAAGSFISKVSSAELHNQEPLLGTKAPQARREEWRPVEPVGYYRTNIGDIRALVLSDGAFNFPQVHPLFGPEGAPNEIRHLLLDGFQNPDVVVGETNILLLEIDGEMVLIDTGFGHWPGGMGGKLISNLRAAGLDPRDIDVVIITHAHRDHVGGLIDPDGNPAFPNARVIINRKEFEFWEAASPDLSSMRVPDELKAQMKERIPRVINAVRSKVELVAPGDKPFGDRIAFLSGEGHTIGHTLILIDGGSQSLLVTSDMVHNQVLSFARPRWTTGFDWAKEAAIETRLKTLDRAATDRLRLLAYHLPWPGLGFVSRDATERYRWHQDRWTW